VNTKTQQRPTTVRHFNTHEPLWEIKYWWRYESYGYQRILIYLVCLLVIWLSWHLITHDPQIATSVEDNPLIMATSDWEPMTAEEVAEYKATHPHELEVIPVQARYEDWVARHETTQYLKRKKTNKQAHTHGHRLKTKKKKAHGSGPK